MRVLLVTIVGSLSLAFATSNQVSYQIAVTLDTTAHSLTGRETFIYRNQSPDTLHDVWLYLCPNAFRDRKSAWARQKEALKNYKFAWANTRDRGYLDVHSLSVDGRADSFIVDDTRMRIVLDQALGPGDSLSVAVEFTVQIPKFFSSFGHRGLHYVMVDWYPRLSAYDSSGWWATRSPKDQSDYGVFGSFDVSITLPAEFILGATGDLVAPADEIDCLDRYAIEGPGLDSLKLGIDVTRDWRPGGTMKTVRLKAERVQDFAWVADRNFRLIRQTLDNVKVNILSFSTDDEWRYAGDYAADALQSYRRSYGPYPYPGMTIARSRSSTNASRPNLVIVRTGGSSFTRALEQTITQGIGSQWFSAVLAPEPIDRLWVGDGLNAYSGLKCLEGKYGHGNTYLKNERIPAPDQRSLYRIIYHVIATNRADGPILGSEEAWAREPMFFSYLSTLDAKPTLIYDMLQNRLGASDFDRAVQRYYRENQFGRATSARLIRLFEEESGQDLSSFSADWLESANYCDYSISCVRRHGNQTLVTVECKGRIQTPIEVMVEDRRGLTQTLTIPGDSAECTASFFLPDVKHVVIDPDCKVLEVDRWNNYYPRKYQIRPVLDVPALDAYQIFFGPFANYGSRTGVTLTAWLHGRRFYDAGQIIGRHQWTANVDYRPKMGNVGYGLSYQTPILVSREVKTRLGLGLSNGLWERKAHAGLTTTVRPWLTAPHGHELYWGLSFREVETVEYVDTLDFEPGRLGEARLSYRYRWSQSWIRSQLDAALQSAQPLGLTDYRYDKVSVTIRPNLFVHPRLTVNTRLFGGFIVGQAPRHEEFFLSGSVRLAGLASFLFGQSGTLSPQERVHFDGGGNAVGYFGRHLHTSRLAGGNIETRFWGLPIIPFFDAAYVDAMSAGSDNGWYLDSGVKVRVGPAAAYFPLWISRPKPGEKKVSFHWVLELKI